MIIGSHETAHSPGRQAGRQEERRRGEGEGRDKLAKLNCMWKSHMNTHEHT